MPPRLFARVALSIAVVLIPAAALAMDEGMSPAGTEPPRGVIERSVEELTQQARHVAIGRVVHLEAHRQGDEARSSTDVELLVDEYLTSDAYEPRLAFTVPGGSPGDGGERQSTGPSLALDERVLVFLQADGTEELSLVEAAQGVWDVSDDRVRSRGTHQTLHLDELRRRARSMLSVPPPAYAGALIIERSVEEITAGSDRVVVARVDRITPRVTGSTGRLESELVLRVEQTVKGSRSGKIKLTLPGGEQGSRRTLVGGVPNFLPNERVLLFLSNKPKLHISGMWQGKYTLVGNEAVQPETGRRVPITQLSERLSQSLQTPVGVSERPSQTLVSASFTTFCVPWTTGTMPVAHFVNPDGAGSGAPTGAAFTRVVYNSMSSWQSLSNSWISMQVAGTTSRTYPGSTDGNHDIGWGNLDSHGSSTIGINFCDTSGGARIDSDTYFDTTGTQWTITAESGKIDLRSVAEHELGHSIGIGHSDQPGCNGSASTPLMCPAIASGTRKVIQSDDSNAAASLYPLSGGAPSNPSGLSASAGSSSVALSWSDPNSSELAIEVQRANGGCGGSFVAVGTVGRNATSFTDNDHGATLPTGTYCYRVKALGQGGDSSFSGTATATIGSGGGGCSPRPDIARNVTPGSKGGLNISLSTTAGSFQRVWATRLSNAEMDAGGVVNVPLGVPVSLSGSQTSIEVYRPSGSSGGYIVELRIEDGCGEYPLFFGSGT